MPLKDIVELLSGETQLFVPQGGDLAFNVEWLEQGEHIDLTSGSGRIVGQNNETILELDDTYVDISSGLAVVRVPAEVTEPLEDWGQGYWTFIGTSITNDTRILAEGVATLRRSAL